MVGVGFGGFEDMVGALGIIERRLKTRRKGQTGLGRRSGVVVLNHIYIYTVL